MDTTFLSHLNWLHILVAALAYFALGAIWYGPLLSKKWIAYQQIDMNNPDAKKGVAAIMFTSFVWMFLVTTALSILVNRLALTEAVSGIKWGLLTGVFFSAAAISITYLYVKKTHRPPLHRRIVPCAGPGDSDGDSLCMEVRERKRESRKQ